MNQHITNANISGQQRSRMLATLFKDERCQQLPAYSILEKMYLDRIIRRSELQEFEALMQTHQKVCTNKIDCIYICTYLVECAVKEFFFRPALLMDLPFWTALYLNTIYFQLVNCIIILPSKN